MTAIFENAIASIQLGVEDFQDGSDARMLSAARNYYAGLVLLAKECLIRAAPDADPMEVIGVKYEPVPNGNGGVDIEVVGYSTIDLGQIKARFNRFKLQWPGANFDKLQKLRNNLEHYHLQEPIGVLKEAIAASFPMIVDFMSALGEDPQEILGSAWVTILDETSSFTKVQESCLNSLHAINWPGPTIKLDRISCSNCASSLVGQKNRDNTSIDSVEAKCYRCGQEFDPEQLAEMVVLAAFEIDDYISAKEGLAAVIGTCPNCRADSYVEQGQISVCYYCRESIAEICYRCGNAVDLNEYNPETPTLCSYCSHQWERIMKE